MTLKGNYRGSTWGEKTVTYNIFFVYPVTRNRKGGINDHDQKDEQCEKIGRERNKSDC